MLQTLAQAAGTTVFLLLSSTSSVAAVVRGWPALGLLHICTSHLAVRSLNILSNASHQYAVLVTMVAFMMVPGVGVRELKLGVWAHRLAFHIGSFLPWLTWCAASAFVGTLPIRFLYPDLHGTAGLVGVSFALAAYQATGWKRCGLETLRNPVTRSHCAGVFQEGLRHGQCCLKSNIGLMTAMVVIGMPPAATVGAFAAMSLERLLPAHALTVTASTLVMAASLCAG